MEKLPFPNSEFNYIFSFASLHHSGNLSETLKEAWRVLKPGGRLIALAEPATSIFMYPLQNRSYKGRAKSLGINENLYTFAQWKSMLWKAGFSQIKIILCKRDYLHRKSLWTWMYYRILRYLPNMIIRLFLGCGVTILAKKVQLAKNVHS